MRNGDIPLHTVRPGDYLFLGYDPLLDDGLATYLFCEPVLVTAVHRDDGIDERSHHRKGCLILKASGYREGCPRRIAIEVIGEAGGRILVEYPDDRHVVAGVNLPD